MAYDSNRLHTVEINWGFPIPLSFINSNWKSTEKGIYYISRIFGSKETPIYIGQTVQSFSKRIGQHLYDKSDFLDKRGDKFIRMGTIVKPKDLSGYDNEQRLLKTIESAIITEVNGITNYSLTNKSQAQSHTIWYDLRIINTGKRGVIPREIYNRNHLIE